MSTNRTVLQKQALFLHAAAIAPDLNAQSVLDRFRIPYFDSFLPRQQNSDGSYVYGLPIIFTLPEILVKRTATSGWTPMANPLYNFKFNQAARKEITFNGFGKLKSPLQSTVRGLDASIDGPNHSYVMQALDNIYNPGNGLGTQSPISLWHVLLNPNNQSWVQMSNHYAPTGRLPSPTYNQNTLEGFHDNIHVELAQGSDDENAPAGHMANPDYAG
jgi:tyrosinase